MYEPFEAISDDFGNTIPVILSPDHGKPAMRIEIYGQFMYITKEQAMNFFGLVDPNAEKEAQ